MATKLEILIKARDEFSVELKRMEDTLQKNYRNVNRLGMGLTAVGAAGAVGFGLAIKGAMDFESSFAGVRKTVDATEEQFAQLEDGFRSMAKQTPINVNEINRIGEAAGQLGIEVENIEAFTKTMADLGVATNMASEEAATSLARLANITQMPEKEFDRLGSTVVALGNNLATTEREIVDFGLRIAGAGKQIRLSEAQILAMGGALSSVGINAEAGGTAISRVMIDIAKAVDEGGEKLERFADVSGLSAEEFRQAFQEDAAGAIVTFIEGLGRVKEEGGSTFQVLEELGQGNIRVRDALLRASGAGDLLRKSLELGATAWEENTALTEEAEKRYATTAAQLQLLQNRINDVAIDIGGQFLPVLNESLQVTGDAVEVWSLLPAPIQEATVRMGAATTGMALFTGGLLLALPRMASMAAGFRAMWQSSVLFRGSLIGGAGLIAAFVLLPPAISKVNQLLKDTERGFSESGVRGEVKALTEDLNRMGIEITETDELLEGVLIRRVADAAREVKVLTDAWREDRDVADQAGDVLGKVAEILSAGQVNIVSAADRYHQLNEAILAVIDAAEAAGMRYPAITRLLRDSSVDMSDSVIQDALEPFKAAWEEWQIAAAMATDRTVRGIDSLGPPIDIAAAQVAGLTDELRALGDAGATSLENFGAELEAQNAPLNAQLDIIGKVTGQRTQEALAIDILVNALEQELVAAKMAEIGQSNLGGATESATEAIQRQIGARQNLAASMVPQALHNEIIALGRELTVLELGKAAIDAQVNARNRLAQAQMAMTRLANLPAMLELKKLQLEREELLAAQLAKTLQLEQEKAKLLAKGDLSDAEKTRLKVLDAALAKQKAAVKAIDDEMEALTRSISIRTLEAEITNLQAEASDKNRVAMQEELNKFIEQIGATTDLKRQRELYIETLVPPALLQEIDELGRQQTALGNVETGARNAGGAVKGLTGHLQDQIDKLVLEKRQLDLVTEALDLQSAAMLDMPSIADMLADLEKVIRLLLQAGVIDILDVVRMGPMPRAIGAQHGFIGETIRPTLFLTSETGDREGVMVTPGGLPGGGALGPGSHVVNNLTLNVEYHSESSDEQDAAEFVGRITPPLRRLMSGV